MGMHIGIITVRDPDYHPNRRLAEAASEQGHRITLVHPYKVWPALKGGEPSLVGEQDMTPLDVVLPRQGATIGAGSTISKDAPPDALTVSRARQTSIAGWKRPVKKPRGDA